MNWIDDLLTDDKSTWHESAKGSWCRKNDSSEVTATVFRNSFGAWQIIINLDRLGRLVANEYYPDSTAALDRADAILGGANCRFLPPKSV